MRRERRWGVVVRGQSKGLAFLKGGVGCLVAFFVLGAVALMVGGTFYFDAGGLVLLFLIGGVIGLLVSWIYGRGRRDAEMARLSSERPQEDRSGDGSGT